MSEFIIHGTPIENLNSILNDKHIKIKPKKKDRMIIHNDLNQIFTQLIFKNIPNEEFQNFHWFTVGIILHKKILKDLPFYANNLGRFSNSFNDGMKRKDLLAKGNGDLKKYPDLKRLRTHIKNDLKNARSSGDFIHSHEILFNQNISLEKYCVCIIINDLQKDHKIINNLNIPIIYRKHVRPGKTGDGIDKMINKIKDLKHS